MCNKELEPADTYELAVYERHGVTSEKAARWTAAEKEGRLVELPCAPGAEVFTINEVFWPCNACVEMGRENISQCYEDHRNPAMFSQPLRECPKRYEIQQHFCSGFYIYKDGNGGAAVSEAGEFGDEGLETFYSDSPFHMDEQYFTREAALAAIAREGVTLYELGEDETY